MIMAPITVAVESLTTPAVAITADSSSKSQYRLSRRLRSGASKKTWSRICSMSTWVRLVTTVVPPAALTQAGCPERSIPGRQPEGQVLRRPDEAAGFHQPP